MSMRTVSEDSSPTTLLGAPLLAAAPAPALALLALEPDFAAAWSTMNHAQWLARMMELPRLPEKNNDEKTISEKYLRL